MKLTNTWKHAAVGAAIGLIWFLLCLIPGMWQLAIFGMVGFLIFTVGWENAQYQRAKKKYVDMIIGMTFPPDKEFAPKEARDAHKGFYAKEFNKQYNWIDAIVDILSAFATFNIGYWTILILR